MPFSLLNSSSLTFSFKGLPLPSDNFEISPPGAYHGRDDFFFLLTLLWNGGTLFFHLFCFLVFWSGGLEVFLLLFPEVSILGCSPCQDVPGCSKSSQSPFPCMIYPGTATPRLPLSSLMLCRGSPHIDCIFLSITQMDHSLIT